MTDRHKIMVTVIALAGYVFLQNPFPPDVNVPKGWHVGYWASGGYGRGALRSPDGLEIGYPDYEPTGQVAYVQYEMYAKTYFFTAVIGRILVQVSVNPDGLLAVSYPSDAPSGYVAKPWPFDYWSCPKGARQVAEALMVPLTRLDRHKAEQGDTSALKYRQLPTPESPFSLMQGVWGRGLVERTPKGLQLGSMSTELESSSPPKPKWSQSATIVDGTLDTAEDASGKIWVTFATPGKKAVIFSASDKGAPAIVLATLAALTYSTGR
jgi:hypothetical protein